MIRDGDFAESYTEWGLAFIFDEGIRGSDFANPSSELARYIAAHDDLLDSVAEFLDTLDDIVDTVLDNDV